MCRVVIHEVRWRGGDKNCLTSTETQDYDRGLYSAGTTEAIPNPMSSLKKSEQALIRTNQRFNSILPRG